MYKKIFQGKFQYDHFEVYKNGYFKNECEKPETGLEKASKSEFHQNLV